MVSAVQSKLIEASLMPKAVGEQLSSAVAAKSLDAQKQQGATVLRLLDSATNIGESFVIGNRVDVRA